MHKEVIGLSGKVTGSVIGIFLIFFYASMSIFILLVFGDTVVPMNWAPAMKTGYVSETKVGSSEELRISCVHTISLFKAVLCYITTVWPHCTTIFKAWMERSPPLSSSTNTLCSGGAGKVLRCPFLLQHWYLSAQNSEASQGLDERTEYLIKPIGVALGMHLDALVVVIENLDLSSPLCLKWWFLLLSTSSCGCTRAYYCSSIASYSLFTSNLKSIFSFEASGVVSWKCRNPCQNQPTKNKAVININFHSGHISKKFSRA